MTEGNGDRSTFELARSVASDTALLARKELELARQELLDAVNARLKAVAAVAVTGVLALVALVFLALAAAAALDGSLPGWAALLVVAGGLLVLATASLGIALVRMRRPSLAPEETVRTIKENVEWARTQLRP